MLISHDTFSAGEGFAYEMKNLKRAVLIGAATGGGAHPGESHRLHEHFEVMVANGRSISPMTQSNREGVGVIPDITTDPDDALNHAQCLILTDRLVTEKDEFVRGRINANLSELK